MPIITMLRLRVLGYISLLLAVLTVWFYTVFYADWLLPGGQAMLGGRTTCVAGEGGGGRR